MNKYKITGTNLLWFLIGVLIVVAIAVFSECSNAHAEFLKYPDITLYKISTDEQITIGWDDTNPTVEDYFEFHLLNMGEEKKYLIGKTQTLQVTIYLPRTGLWEFYCRACDLPDTDPNRKCSNYASSLSIDIEGDGLPFGKIEDPDNPGTYIKGKWVIYGHVAAPTGGGVE